MVEVTVPKGSQPGKVLLLRGRGLPRLTMAGASSGSRGDQVVHLRVHVPTKLSPRQQELLEELRKEEEKQRKGEVGEGGEGVGGALRSFADKISDAVKRLKKFTSSS
ncbi:unnamed protein product [Discosporangium mesarthrocarpum]